MPCACHVLLNGGRSGGDEPFLEWSANDACWKYAFSDTCL